ncbi:hypothetical protein V8F33_003796 [Rhypophila sp. PSN 637]
MAPTEKTIPPPATGEKPPILRGRTIRAIGIKAKAAFQSLRSPWRKRIPSPSKAAADANPAVSPSTGVLHDEPITPVGVAILEGGLEVDLEEYRSLCFVHRLDIHSIVKESEGGPPKYYYSRNMPYKGKWFYYERRDTWIAVDEVAGILHDLHPTPETIIKPPSLGAPAAEENREREDKGEGEGEGEGEAPPTTGQDERIGRETWYLKQKRIVSWLGKVERGRVASEARVLNNARQHGPPAPWQAMWNEFHDWKAMWGIDRMLSDLQASSLNLLLRHSVLTAEFLFKSVGIMPPPGTPLSKLGMASVNTHTDWKDNGGDD